MTYLNKLARRTIMFMLVTSSAVRSTAKSIVREPVFYTTINKQFRMAILATLVCSLALLLDFPLRSNVISGKQILPAETPSNSIFLPVVVNEKSSGTPSDTPTPTSTPASTDTPTSTNTSTSTSTMTPTSTETSTSTPTSTPIDGKIVFVSNRDGKEEIYSMEDNGSTQVRLTNNDEYDFSPEWSRDGTKIVFSREDFIYSMKSDGSEVTTVTNEIHASDSAPSWSIDERIVFARMFTNIPGVAPTNIVIVNADGSGERFITSDGNGNNNPSWSPDGTKVVYGRVNGINVVNDDGSGRVVLSTNFNDDYAPDWSPDGKRIVFTSYRDGNAEIYIMNADGSAQKNLTNNSAFDGGPSWSPDGRQIAFYSDRDGNNEIYIINADGSQPTRLTNNLFSDATPDWGIKSSN